LRLSPLQAADAKKTAAYPDVPAKWSELFPLEYNGMKEAEAEHHAPPVDSKR